MRLQSYEEVSVNIASYISFQFDLSPLFFFERSYINKRFFYWSMLGYLE